MPSSPSPSCRTLIAPPCGWTGPRQAGSHSTRTTHYTAAAHLVLKHMPINVVFAQHPVSEHWFAVPAPSVMEVWSVVRGKSGANSHEQPRKVLAMKLERRRLKGHRSPLKCKVLLFGQFFIPSAHLSHNAGQRQRPELKPFKHSIAAFKQVDFY